jgi:hypothetical protein
MTIDEIKAILIDAMYTNGEGVEEVRSQDRMGSRGFEVEFADGQTVKVTIESTS